MAEVLDAPVAPAEDQQQDDLGFRPAKTAPAASDDIGFRPAVAKDSRVVVPPRVTDESIVDANAPMAVPTTAIQPETPAASVPTSAPQDFYTRHPHIVNALKFISGDDDDGTLDPFNIGKTFWSGAKTFASGIKDVYTPTEAEKRANGNMVEHGISASPGAPMTDAERSQANRQAIGGLAKVLAGGGQVGFIIGAPELSGLAAAAATGDAAAIAALARIGVSVGVGAGASAGAGKLADTLKLSPEAKALAQQAAFWTAAGLTGYAAKIEPTKGDFGAKGFRASVPGVDADLGFRPAYRQPSPEGSYGEGSTVVPAKVNAGVTVAGRRFGTAATRPATQAPIPEPKLLEPVEGSMPVEKGTPAVPPEVSPEGRAAGQATADHPNMAPAMELATNAHQPVGTEDPQSGRPIIQPTDNPAINQALATSHMPEFEEGIGKAISGIPGASLAATRAEKNPERLAEKINGEGKPASTVSDYGAVQISVDSPEARDETVAAIKKAYPVVVEDDKFEKGDPDYGYRNHSLQVQTPTGGTMEVQIVPKEVMEANPDEHGNYKSAREAKIAGNDAEFEKQAADAKAKNDAAMEKFNARNETEKKVSPKEASQKPLYEMSQDEIGTALEEAKGRDAADMVKLFGDEGAKRYKQLQRAANNAYDMRRADAASDEIAKMEDALTPAQRDVLYGIGDERHQPEALNEYSTALGRIDGATPEELAESMRYAVSRLDDPSADPATMRPGQQIAYAQLRHGFQIAQEHAWDANAIIRKAITSAAKRFSDPEDAVFMLEKVARAVAPETKPAKPETKTLDVQKQENSAEIGGRGESPEPAGGGEIAPAVESDRTPNLYEQAQHWLTSGGVEQRLEQINRERAAAGELNDIVFTANDIANQLIKKFGGRQLPEPVRDRLVRMAEKHYALSKGGRGESPEQPAAGGAKALPAPAKPRSYDDVQKDIDRKEDELEAAGGDVTKLYFPNTAEVLKDAPGWNPMPDDLAKLYEERDSIGSGQLQESIADITKGLKAAGITKDSELRRVLAEYSLDASRTDGAKQYLAAEHTQNTVAQPLAEQVAKMYSMLAADRGIFMDDRDDLYRDRQTTIDAAKAVKAIVSYFRGEPVNVDKFLPKKAPTKIEKGSAVTLSDGTSGTVAWSMGGKARVKTADGSRRDVPVKELYGAKEPEKNAEAPKELSGVREPKAVAEGAKKPTEATKPAVQPSGEPVAGVEVIKPGAIGEMRSADLRTDSKRFQYKLNTDASGASGKLKDVKWNPELSGILTAWTDPADGVAYVVNGHHRLERAEASGGHPVAVRMLPDTVKTAAEARIVGALQNIAEGNGTAIDAAKFLRDTGYTPAELGKYGIAMTGQVAEGGAALAKLDQKFFDDVVAGRIPERRGIAIARAADTPEAQEALVKMLAKAEAKGRTITNATIEELGRMVKGAETVTTSQDSLFGMQTRTQNTALEKAEVSAYLRNQLGQEKKLFAGLSDKGKAEKASAVGTNNIDTDENRKVATRAEQAQEIYDRLSTRTGPVDDILNHAAKRIAEGENANTVKTEAYRSLRTALSEALRGGSKEVGRSDQGNASRSETQEVAPTLHGMDEDVARQAESAADVQREDNEATLASSKGNIDKAAGEMERNSPLFRDSEASGQGGLFGGDQEPLIESDPKAAKKAADLGSTFHSGFLDPELFKQLFPDVVDRMKEWLTNETTSGDEQRAVMRQTRGEMDRRLAVVMQKLSGQLREWRTRPREDSIAFWNAVEGGKVDTLPEKDQALANLFKGAFDKMRGEIQQLKPEALRNYIENYFPHLWEKPSVVSSAIKGALTGKRPFAGKASFLKQRTIPTMQDGLDLGFKPKTWNPVESFMLKYSEMAQFLMGHQTLQMMKEAGTAKYVGMGKKAPDGWTQLDDRIASVYRQVKITDEDAINDATYNMRKGAGKRTVPAVAVEDIPMRDATVLAGHYYAPADAAKVFNNFVSRGLAGRSGIYDVLNWTNQNLNALQLGISAFHAATTSINAATSDVALGIQQLAEGKPFEAGVSLVRGMAIAPSIISTMVNGSRMMREYLTPGSYAKFSEEAKALAEAGGRVKMNSIEIKPLSRTINAWRNGAIREGLTSLPAAILDATTRPVMEYYVPRMKVGAFYSMAHDIMDQAQRNNWPKEKTRAKMQQAWDSIDNRFGQMVYDNLFWHKGMRDVLQLATRSVGWNFGDIRELGGGITDTARAAGNAGRGKMPEVTPRMAFALALPIVSAIIGGVLTYLWTGEKPQTWKDYFYPRTADGTRHSIPGYMKDVFAFGKAPVQTALNKMGPLWSMTADAVNNRDFYGTEIRHKDDPAIKQLTEFSSWAAKQMLPFAISGSAKLLEKHGAEPTLEGMMRGAKEHVGDIALGQLGFAPAPASIQNSSALNAAREYNRENRPPGTKTQEQADHLRAFGAVIQMYRTGHVDHDQIERYRKEGLLPGNSVARAAMESRYQPIAVASRGLSVEQILNVYDKGTEQEKDILRPLVARKFKEIREIPDPEQRAGVEAAYQKAIGEAHGQYANK